MRLARFNVQSTTQADKRYFIGLASPAAAGVIASTVFAFPRLLTGHAQQIAAVCVVIVPAVLMVSTLRYRSFKTFNLGYQQSRLPLLAFVVFLVLLGTQPQATLIVMAYAYLSSAFIGQVVSRLRSRKTPAAAGS